ncbi:MAG TPA: LacI family DNA-binding transcriptional regulator [Micropruina sp.]|mgnify:CR=1 FL=1|nr:LacI family DNA-binding transcriptional regulator [Micropruina sp.]HMR21695.1 LacI family DNA-binding transcriptional regulator [Micropruina sp.]
MQHPVTIEDVAAAAGVSRQTVSRAMNAMTGISPATRDRVLEVARDLRYRPSRFGRGLAKPDHRMLGLVLNDITNPYYPALASAVTGAANRVGWNVLLADTSHSEDREAFLADLASQVDGVVGYLWLDPLTQDRLFAGMPVVEIDPPRHQPRHGAVTFNLRPAMRDLVRYLATKGVRRVLMIDEAPPDGMSARARLLASELDRRGLALDHAPIETGSVAGDLAAIGATLDARPGAEAILAYNDLSALGVMSALRDRGRRVPDDVRVIGIDGVGIGDLMTPRPTTLALDMSKVGRLAIELVLGMRTGEVPLSGSAARRRVRHRLVLRDSA